MGKVQSSRNHRSTSKLLSLVIIQLHLGLNLPSFSPSPNPPFRCWFWEPLPNLFCVGLQTRLLTLARGRFTLAPLLGLNPRLFPLAPGGPALLICSYPGSITPWVGRHFPIWPPVFLLRALGHPNFTFHYLLYPFMRFF